MGRSATANKQTSVNYTSKSKDFGPRDDAVSFQQCLALLPTRLPFVILVSRRAQSGIWSSFGKRVWFTESDRIVIISSLFVVLFTQFIFDKIQKGLLYQVKQPNNILLK